jgi:hypothetical protein
MGIVILMRTIKAYFENGDTLITDINGTNEVIIAYYVGNIFTVGGVRVKCIKVEFYE